MFTFFLPAVGYRGVSDGLLIARGVQGEFWGAMQHTGRGTQFKATDSESVVMNTGSNSFGFNIRCVR